MIFILGTKSALKLQAIQYILNKYLIEDKAEESYTILQKNVESNVSHTPRDNETYQGAKNRAEAVYNLFNQEGDYFVGIESGLVEREGYIFEECWCVIYDKQKHEYVGYSSGFMLPDHVTHRMKQGETHIEVLSDLEKELGIDGKDTWAIYSHNKIQRVDSIKEAFRNALLSIETI